MLMSRIEPSSRATVAGGFRGRSLTKLFSVPARRCDGGMSAFAYVRGDPVNRRDPTGTEMVCSAPAGTRVPACVGVDGDGDGQYHDRDLTSSQESAIANAFAGFIQTHGRNQNLSPYGKRVDGSAIATDKAMVRVVSQFVGYVAAHAVSRDNNATANAFRADWNRISHIQADRNFTSQDDASSMLNDHRSYWIQIRGGFGLGDSRSMYGFPSDLARLMFHETLHIRNPDEYGPRRREIHEGVDRWARQVTTEQGFGRCQPVGHHPGCD